ncbi:oligopeptide/dipeptide ABC transporter ATP-binding protein [Herbaspirillum sp. Sphag1AN]|uniref:ABC transporter ATP-binding protein n=1 Tax=unclassified Herbaspirillum TaxID=2624150 RepID=UPI00160D3C60|nr:MULTISPECIES: oligopeptide/dipeptide ABC transporter ATP-binding protein [unclassified Herbaspirillum]MBB3214448.1 oligopeptide/dipeptide ABC transporter ATP-binding protein [Herbaspirillum sp. Sphag1AN]MBB3247448.1 oligopeptide/dipeptide ABC transporter ATP-binding protein [Herbaspirillum sp. Sphag64]
MANSNLLQVSGLRKYFTGKRGAAPVKAVDDVSFTLDEGKTLGLVGESGCGKSTTGRSVLRLIEPTAGSVRFMGEELCGLSAGALRRTRRHMQMIFQDPFASLNPRMTIGELLEEPLIVHDLFDRAARRRKVAEMLDVVGLSQTYASRHPHEFSGGQRQRVGIARAVITRPKLVVADEAVSALDISIQAQILNLLQDLQREFALTYLFISHDLAVIRHMSDSIGVMYLGRMVEYGSREHIYRTPKHPYARALLSAIPREHPDEVRERIILSGAAPNPAAPPAGCHFHPRCVACMKICETEAPPQIETAPGEFVACHLYR